MLTTDTTTSQSHNKTKLLPLLIGLFCIILAIGSTLWFWSALITIRPLKLITAWEQQSSAFEPILAIELIPRLEQSIAINPLRAESYITLARLYEQLVHNSDLVNDNKSDTTNSPAPNQQQTRNQQPNQNHLNLAELNYNLAIQQQPTWDYAWARLAAFYSHSRKQEQLTLKVLSRAMLLGPYESKTQKIIIPLIFEHWALINKTQDMGEQAEKIVRRALNSYPHVHLVLSAAKEFNKFDELAPLLSKQWQKNSLKRYQNEYRTKLVEQANHLENGK
jgi:hypothetical protein